MVVGVDEARHDRHAFGVVDLRTPARERFHIVVLANRNEPAALDRKGFRTWFERIDRVDPGVVNDEIGLVSGTVLG